MPLIAALVNTLDVVEDVQVFMDDLKASGFSRDVDLVSFVGCLDMM